MMQHVKNQILSLAVDCCAHENLIWNLYRNDLSRPVFFFSLMFKVKYFSKLSERNSLALSPRKIDLCNNVSQPFERLRDSEEKRSVHRGLRSERNEPETHMCVCMWSMFLYMLDANVYVHQETCEHLVIKYHIHADERTTAFVLQV